MYATLRSIKVKPGTAAEVGALIEAEYVPLLNSVPGFVSYTLADLGGDEVRSLGIFTDEAGARQANEVARDWTGRRLSGLVESPLDAREGTVLVDVRAGRA